LWHPLHSKIYLVKNKGEINLQPFNAIGPIEKTINFVNENKKIFSFNDGVELEAICLYFIVHRRISNRQKKRLSRLGGEIAEHRFDSNIKLAIDFINKNHVLLDEFNSLWYKNFSKYFLEGEVIQSKKIRNAIFNMAGTLLVDIHPA